MATRVITQARRRILDGERVANAEKIYSIFEPHTDLIMRGKARTPLEFGNKVFLAESVKGLITQYKVLNGNPLDAIHVAPSLKCHKKVFGHAPKLYGADRGFFSEQNLASCAQRCHRSVYSTARRAFKKGQRFRAGIEGRISVLSRGRGMKRCLAEGSERFELWVSAAVLANNLWSLRRC